MFCCSIFDNDPRSNFVDSAGLLNLETNFFSEQLLNSTTQSRSEKIFFIAVRPGPRIVSIDMTEMNSRVKLEPREHKTRFEIIYYMKEREAWSNKNFETLN